MTAGEEKEVVLVTGGSRGLGRTLSIGFARSGYRVAVHFRSDRDAAEETVRRIRENGGKAVSVAADLSVPESAARMVDRVLDIWGGLHVLINNAGEIHDGPLVSLSEGAWSSVMETCLSAPFRLIRRVTPVMEKQGGGRIVNIVSIAGVRGSTGQANYAAAKAGLVGLTRAAARELGPMNIRVNAVSPGFMETDMTKRLPDQVRARALRESCLHRFCDPREVFLFVGNLVRLEGVTGQVFCVDSRIG
ncbi:MAG: SDR family NAD(P)-dependent oxidoreductase [Deltaproteobacteria bacterium]|nr:SDR family NAD(P)-dependent oxidoreductase [Deltaproteobacteria bacterium]